MEPEFGRPSVRHPFVGVVDMRGVAYESKSTATGLGAFLFNQLLETDARARDYKQTREEALALLRKAMELSTYTDRSASAAYDLAYVEVRVCVCRNFLLGRRVFRKEDYSKTMSRNSE